MGAPADQHALREALARAVEAGASNGRTTAKIVDDLFAAGSPLASLIAERDDNRGAADLNLTQLKRWRDRALAAEAENIRLKETVEAARKALGLAIQFVDVAAGEGLSFDADGDRPMMDAADVCFAVAETLGIDDLDSDAYRALVARSILTTIPPKENP